MGDGGAPAETRARQTRQSEDRQRFRGASRPLIRQNAAIPGGTSISDTGHDTQSTGVTNSQNLGAPGTRPDDAGNTPFAKTLGASASTRADGDLYIGDRRARCMEEIERPAAARTASTSAGPVALGMCFPHGDYRGRVADHTRYEVGRRNTRTGRRQTARHRLARLSRRKNPLSAGFLLLRRLCFSREENFGRLYGWSANGTASAILVTDLLISSFGEGRGRANYTSWIKRCALSLFDPGRTKGRYNPPSAPPGGVRLVRRADGFALGVRPLMRSEKSPVGLFVADFRSNPWAPSSNARGMKIG